MLQKCTYLPALQSLLSQAPAEILENVVGQFAKILPADAKARKQFVTSGGLKKIQEIKTEPDSELAEAVLTINECFPEEIVRYYSPGRRVLLGSRLIRLLHRVSCLVSVSVVRLGDVLELTLCRGRILGDIAQSAGSAHTSQPEGCSLVTRVCVRV